MNHDQVQPLLALSAAGLLDAAGERSLREHARECPACAAQMEALSSISAALTARPAPALSPDLLRRTQARISAELAMLAERRRSVWIAAGAGVFAWIMNLATWIAFQLWRGGVSAVLRPRLPGLLAWLALSAFSACIAAPAAIALMAARRRMEGRI